MDHTDKIVWMTRWASEHGGTITLAGECGIGRECVGLLVGNCYPDYDDGDEDVWIPPNAYHKHPCVAVLGRGEVAEDRLYQWLKWFDDNGYTIEVKPQEVDPRLPRQLSIALGKHLSRRMVKRQKEASNG